MGSYIHTANLLIPYHVLFIQLHVGESHTQGLVFFGLSLHSASWDPECSSLAAPQVEAADRSPYCAVVSFKLGATTPRNTPTACEGTADEQWHCPILLANRTRNAAHLNVDRRAVPPLFHVPLALSAKPGSDQNVKAYLSCDSDYHNAYVT